MFRKTNIAKFSIVVLFVKARCIIEAKTPRSFNSESFISQGSFERLSESIDVDENFHFYYDILKEMAANKI